jgi:hypothetical protein
MYSVTAGASAIDMAKQLPLGTRQLYPEVMSAEPRPLILVTSIAPVDLIRGVNPAKLVTDRAECVSTFPGLW